MTAPAGREREAPAPAEVFTEHDYAVAYWRQRAANTEAALASCEAEVRRKVAAELREHRLSTQLPNDAVAALADAERIARGES